MNGEWTGLTWDELDRLADYTAGALTGVEADEVARLIQTDDRWAAAHAELLAAQPSVSAALRTAATTPVAMPPEVAARLDAALAAARVDHHRTTKHRATGRRSRPQPVRPGTRPGRRSRLSPLLVRVAAGVIALAAVGGGVTAVALRTGLPGVSDAAMDAREEMPYADQEVGAPSVTADMATGADFLILASGTDYTTASLRDLVFPSAVPPPAPKSKSDREAELSRLAVDDSLAEIASPDGLTGCLDAVRRAYPGVIRVVDFARFEGTPAVVIAVDEGGAWTVVAVGAGCGASNLTELASVSVG